MSLKYFADAEDLEWIVDGFLARGAITVLVGDAGTGKTSLCLQLTAAMQAGRPFMGLNVVQGNTLWIEQDESPAMMKDVISKMLTHSPELATLAYHAENFAPSNGDWKSQANMVIQDIRDLKAHLMIIDAWEAMGLRSFNAMEDTEMALKTIRLIMESTDIAVLIIHHFNKPKEGSFQTKLQRVHGAQALIQATDCVLFLEESGGKIKLWPSKKFRGYRRFESILMSFNQVTLESTHFNTIHNPWDKEVEENEDRNEDPWDIS